jgi:hypothetical protein
MMPCQAQSLWAIHILAHLAQILRATLKVCLPMSCLEIIKGATREELLGNYQGATREELLGDPFNLSSAQPYMDIYQSSMDPAVREIEKQTLQAQNQARATAARGGSFGGSRLGIIEGTAAGEGSRAAGDLRAQAAKEGLGFAAGRFDTDRAARAATEATMRNRFTQDQQSRFGAEDVMRGQFMEDRQGRMSVEDTRRAQAESDRAARFGAEDVMYGRYGDQTSRSIWRSRSYAYWF